MTAGPDHEPFDHERWADSAGAYLLSALAPAEQEGFEAHLATCAICRDDVADLQVASDALPASVPQVEPPPELRDRIMTIVRREAELLAAAGPEADRPARARAARTSWVPGWLRRPAIALPAMACLLIAGVLAGVVGSDALRGGGVPVKTVQASCVGPCDARLEVHEDSTRLVAEHLPAPPAGRVYQVWLQREGAKDPEPTAALFKVRGDGKASVDVPGNLHGVKQVMVTDEPDGGSQHPTGTIEIAAPVPA